jgi:CrcB protein
MLRTTISNILFVAAGGAAGSALRYLVSLAMAPSEPGKFPVHTLIVNVAGCLLMGLLAPLLMSRTGLPDGVRLLVTTGLLGGLTTYSTFNHEMLLLLQYHGPLRSAAYFLATVLSCLVAGFAGLLLSTLVSPQG